MRIFLVFISLFLSILWIRPIFAQDCTEAEDCTEELLIEFKGGTGARCTYKKYPCRKFTINENDKVTPTFYYKIDLSVIENEKNVKIHVQLVHYKSKEIIQIFDHIEEEWIDGWRAHKEECKKNKQLGIKWASRPKKTTEIAIYKLKITIKVKDVTYVGYSDAFELLQKCENNNS